MKISDLIARLEPIAKAAPDTVVLVARERGELYPEVEAVDSLRIQRRRGPGDCGPHAIDLDGNEDVVVIS